MRVGNKKIFHLEAWVVKVMSLYKVRPVPSYSTPLAEARGATDTDTDTDSSHLVDVSCSTSSTASTWRPTSTTSEVS